MLTNRRTAGAALAVALAVGAGPATGAAQNSTYDPAATEMSCTARTTTGCSMAGSPCGDGGECRMLRGGGLTCVPPIGFVCCTSDEQCFFGEDGDAFACVDTPEVMGADGVSSTGLCVPSPTCVGDDDALSLEELFQNLSTEAAYVGRWAGGDFDRDGLTNGEEVALGTDPCVTPAPRAFWDGEACVAIPVGCDAVGDGCTAHDRAGTCEITDDGTECVPDADQQWCGGDFACDEGEAEAVDPARGQIWCVPNDCEGLVESLLACISAGENLVPYASGDCDGDGTVNDVDDTPCGDLPDAGPPQSDDAGTTPTPDAGDADGFDAGTDGTQPSFEGGGGCRCRAATASGELPRGLALLGLALGLALARPRRRR